MTQQTGVPAACPRCGELLPDDDAGLPWCDSCDWNVDPYPPAPPSTRLARHLAALGEQFDEGLLAAARRPQDRPRSSAARVGALALGWCMHFVTLCVVAAALLVATVSPLAPVFRWFVAALLGLIAIAVFPRLPGLARDERTLDRSAAPALFSLLDDVARVAGTSAPHTVVVDNEFNAWATTIGWRRRRVIGIGRPLWVLLSPQQRVALLGHELGHLAGTDCRDGLVVTTAMQSLSQWYRLIAPMAANESIAFQFAATPYAADRAGGTYRVETEAGVAVFNAVMALPRKVLAGYLRLLTMVAARASQHAEYRADTLAASAGSPAAAIGLIERLYLAPVVRTWRLRVSRRKGPFRWQELVDDVHAVPSRQIERMRRVGRSRRQRIDASHPSNAARIDVLTALPDAEPAVTLTAPANEAVLKEILASS
jgi:Zn-dependent protease with chaperone function